MGDWRSCSPGCGSSRPATRSARLPLRRTAPFWLAVAASLQFKLIPNDTAFAFFLLGWTIFTGLMLIATLKTNVALMSLFGLLFVTFVLLTIAKFTGRVGSRGGLLRHRDRDRRLVQRAGGRAPRRTREDQTADRTSVKALRPLQNFDCTIDVGLADVGMGGRSGRCRSGRRPGTPAASKRASTSRLLSVGCRKPTIPDC